MASADYMKDILRRVQDLPKVDQQVVLSHLRRLHPIHEIEAQWGVPAEVILEAISRSSDLSQRGIRGLIAEAYFETCVLPTLEQWEDVSPPPGNVAYDFAIRKGERQVRIQVKTQRRKAGRPMTANEGYRRFPSDLFVVETQKTRSGTSSDGGDTRPYRFDDFDILAVNMEPATGKWEQFRYTLTRWLVPREDDTTQMLKFQPVALTPNEDWTDSLGTCLAWLESGVEKTIRHQRRA